MTDSVERLTRAVARTIGDGPGPVRRARQRAAVARLTRPPARARSEAWWLVPLAAAAIVALLLARRPATLSAPITATVAEQAVMVGAWLAAPGHEALTIEFSDTSRAVLAASAAARLVRAEDQRVELHLERGAVTLYVHAVPGREWSVGAGPFTVALGDGEGTAAWTPETRTLVVEVRRGSAIVSGGGGSDRVAAGQRLELRDAQPGPIELAAGSDAPPIGLATDVAGSPAPDPRPELATDPATIPAPAPPAGSRPRRVERPAWVLLADAGDHGGALAAAERLGFARLLRSLGVDDLDRLARSARFAGAGARAREALLALRRRFPADARARTAAFLLGRVALDLEGDAAAAGAWFSTYMSEAPGGPLAAEARRRLTELGASQE